MKILLIPAFLSVMALLHAADAPKPEPESETAAAASTPPVAHGLEYSDAPQVTIDLLAISLPTEKAVALLPALRDPKRIEEAQTKLLALVEKKEAKLIGWPEITTLSGTRSLSEDVTEYKYPIEFQNPAEAPTEADGKEKKMSPGWKIEKPSLTTVETKNLGTTIDVEPVVESGGKGIMIAVEAQTVEVVKIQEYHVATNPKGEAINSPHVIFGTMKATNTVRLQSGDRMLLHAGQLKEDEGRMTLFILGAKIQTSD